MPVTIREGLYSLLTGSAAVYTLVGLRVYPGSAPQSATLPFIVQKQASRRKVPTHEGTVNLNLWDVDLEVKAATEASAAAVADAVRTLLDGYSGTPGTGLKVRGCWGESEDDDEDAPLYGDEQGRFTVRQTWTLAYKENVT